MSWRGEEGGIAAAKAGHDVVMAPQKPTYFDHYQSKDPKEPQAIGGHNSLADVYAYEFELKPVTFAARDGVESAFANVVTTNYFATLGVLPAAGRVFAAAESDC